MTDMDHASFSGRPSYSRLLAFVENYDWVMALNRLASHPQEAKTRGPRGRTALHIACDHDAPASVVQVLLNAYPDAASMVGTSDMTPLHITVSSQRASVEVVKLLLDGSPSRDAETTAKDIDGDTPLHAACRCGAPIEVLEMLLKREPSVVLDRDNEGLTPLLRLWVRYYVILGEEVIEKVCSPADITAELREAWFKTALLLKATQLGSMAFASERNGAKFKAVHAAAAADCPRAVLKIAMALYPEQLEETDDRGRSPLVVASMAPTYKVHDLSESEYNYDELDGDAAALASTRGNDVEITEEQQIDDDPHRIVRVDGTAVVNPSVIEVILDTKPQLARLPHADGRLPLVVAVARGKGWKEGVECLIKAYPESISIRDCQTRLYPFMLAAAKFDINSCVAKRRSEKLQLGLIYELLKLDPELVRSDAVGYGVTNIIDGKNTAASFTRGKSNDHIVDDVSRKRKKKRFS